MSISKCVLLHANLEYHPSTGGVLTPTPPTSALCYQQSTEEIDSPWASWEKKRMHLNLIWLWCMIFILASATEPSRTHNTILLHFERSTLAKSFRCGRRRQDGTHLKLFCSCSIKFWWNQIEEPVFHTKHLVKLHYLSYTTDIRLEYSVTWHLEIFW